MADIGFGLVGYGIWGRHHAQAIRETPGCVLRAVCAASPESRSAASETGADVYADFRELLARNDLDVVNIVVPNHLHESVACAALDSGRHVLLEKPIATTISSCDRILESASRANRHLLIGHELRYSCLYRQIKELIQCGAIGEPRYILVDIWRRPYWQGSESWRFDPKRVGNWILEEPIHYFDLIGWFMDGVGQPSSIYARANRKDPSAASTLDINENLSAIVNYPNGAYALFTETFSAVEHHVSVKIFGSKSALRSEWHAEEGRAARPTFSLEHAEDGRMKQLEVPSTPGDIYELREEINAIVNAVRYDAPLPIRPEEARRAVLLCTEARRSLETGAVISLC